MKSAADFKPSSEFALLLLGPPFSGKTNVLMSFPEPYIISTDKKLSNAVARHPGKQFWYDYVSEDTESGVGIPEAKRWDRLTDLIVKAKDKPGKTLGIDNLSDVGMWLISYILSQPSGDRKKLMVGGQQVMDQAHWGPYATLLERFIWACRASGKMVVVCCHETIKEDKLTGTLHYKPSIQGQLQDRLGKIFTDTWRCVVETTATGPRYRVQTVPDSRSELGSSVQGLPARFDFSWEELDKRLNPKAA